MQCYLNCCTYPKEFSKNYECHLDFHSKYRAPRCIAETREIKRKKNFRSDMSQLQSTPCKPPGMYFRTVIQSDKQP